MTLSFTPSEIEMWPLARLKPYAKNAKTHGAEQVAKIAASMAEFGWTTPVLVDGAGEVIAGHGRILAAAQLGLPEVPVIVLGHLTEAQRRAYRLADNKLTELGGWDDTLLGEELRDLMDERFDCRSPASTTGRSRGCWRGWTAPRRRATRTRSRNRRQYR
jgi:ParB-like chromosome segregation protein Spo0J